MPENGVENLFAAFDKSAVLLNLYTILQYVLQTQLNLTRLSSPNKVEEKSIRLGKIDCTILYSLLRSFN